VHHYLSSVLGTRRQSDEAGRVCGYVGLFCSMVFLDEGIVRQPKPQELDDAVDVPQASADRSPAGKPSERWRRWALLSALPVQKKRPGGVQQRASTKTVQNSCPRGAEGGGGEGGAGGSVGSTSCRV
jgi:hypothetical protein